jgi:hypothetical protein
MRRSSAGRPAARSASWRLQLAQNLNQVRPALTVHIRPRGCETVGQRGEQRLYFVRGCRRWPAYHFAARALTHPSSQEMAPVVRRPVRRAVAVPDCQPLQMPLPVGRDGKEDERRFPRGPLRSRLAAPRSALASGDVSQVRRNLKQWEGPGIRDRPRDQAGERRAWTTSSTTATRSRLFASHLALDARPRARAGTSNGPRGASRWTCCNAAPIARGVARLVQEGDS